MIMKKVALKMRMVDKRSRAWMPVEIRFSVNVVVAQIIVKTAQKKAKS